jgi:hypothetical protein
VKKKNLLLFIILKIKKKLILIHRKLKLVSKKKMKSKIVKIFMLFLLITLKMALAETIMINENQMLPDDCDNISLSDETGKYFNFII